MGKIIVSVSIQQVLQQIMYKNRRSYGYYLGMLKKNGRPKNYVKVINKMFYR